MHPALQGLVCSLQLKYASLPSGPHLHPSHSSPQMAPYLLAIHHHAMIMMIMMVHDFGDDHGARCAVF
eukprot:1141844-Pelagomonas_calceolata.AAC.1